MGWQCRLVRVFLVYIVKQRYISLTDVACVLNDGLN